jgi:hypothetical protein
MDLNNIENFKCSRCKEIQELTKFTETDTDGQILLYNSCFDCRQLKEPAPEHKRCKKCKKEKPFTDFYKIKNYKSSNCIQCYRDKYAALKATKSNIPAKQRDNVLLSKDELVYTNKQEYVKAYTKKYYSLKKDVYKKRYEANKEEIRKKQNERYHKKKELLKKLIKDSNPIPSS